MDDSIKSLLTWCSCCRVRAVRGVIVSLALAKVIKSRNGPHSRPNRRTPPASTMEQPARNFNLYWGFGEPLEVLDDRALLADMARLKQRANYPDGKTLPQSPRIAPPGVPPPSTKSAPSLRSAASRYQQRDRRRGTCSTSPSGGRARAWQISR